ncbi:MAG: PIN domain-containing protein [Candidatus Sigynarchaeota archaeon]
MKIVVDANILFAAIIKDSYTSRLFLVDDLEFFAPDFLFMEFEKYEDVIIEKTSRSKEKVQKYITFLKRTITTIPERTFKDLFKDFVPISPDPKDIPYPALAKRIQASIWSNDKKLKEKQSNIEVVTTADLVKRFLDKNGK